MPDTKPRRKRLEIYPHLCSPLGWCSRTFQLTFGLWELAKHRDCQEKLRAEINDTLEKVRARGDADFTASDFENMPYLVAFMKVRRDRPFVSPIGSGIH